MAAITPMMKQYEEIKAKHNDCILFFRMGDFYEMFNDDAIKASRELEIVLTGRSAGEDTKAPMCGVPFHSANSYIAKLVSKGYKVAVCEQIQDASEAKGLVERDVVRIITPGTVLDTSLLDEKSNNYLGCVFADEGITALVFADISTGEIYATKILSENKNEVLNEIARYSPKEILLNYDAKISYEKILSERFGCYVNNLDNEAFAFSAAYEKIMHELDLDDIADINLAGENSVISAAGAVIEYLTDTQKSSLFRALDLIFYQTEQYVDIDVSTRRNLEITETMRDKAKKGSLLWVLDKTRTSMGGRMLKQWVEKPLISPAGISFRQNGVSELLGNMPVRNDIGENLSRVFDIARLINRISLGSATPRDMLSLRESLKRLPELKQCLAGFNSDILKKQMQELDVMADICELLECAVSDEPPVNLRDGGVIKDGYDTRVDEYRNAMSEGTSWLAQIQESEREATGIKTLKVGFNKVFGYYIEVSAGQAKNVPEHYVRKQTLTNGERYITQKLKDIESVIIGAEERLLRLEVHLFEELRTKVASQIERLRKTANAVAVVDVLISFAEVAEQYNYTMPAVDYSGKIIIKDGRHPVVEKMLKSDLFVPNDTMLDEKDNRLCVITGPNMAGKSTYMRQVALIVLMAQIGSFVPAQSAQIGVVDKIFTRVGASDDLSSGQSTFMVEMNEVANILSNATKNSLIIFDEIGRGTSTYDGLSIAWAVVEHVSDKKKIGAKTLFATHYHELTELEDKLDGVKNYCVAAKKRGDDVTFLRKIIRGGADGSYGIEVAAIAGVSGDVIRRAKQILKSLEESDINRTDNVKMKIKAADKSEADDAQIGFESINNNIIIEELKRMDITTYTPIEALNMLNGLINRAREL